MQRAVAHVRHTRAYQLNGYCTAGDDNPVHDCRAYADFCNECWLLQAYWQSAIAARPTATWKGYILGGLMYALSWFLPTLAVPSLPESAIARLCLGLNLDVLCSTLHDSDGFAYACCSPHVPVPTRSRPKASRKVCQRSMLMQVVRCAVWTLHVAWADSQCPGLASHHQRRQPRCNATTAEQHLRRKAPLCSPCILCIWI